MKERNEKGSDFNEQEYNSKQEKEAWENDQAKPEASGVCNCKDQKESAVEQPEQELEDRQNRRCG
jgi:hypothetical protein